MGMSCQLRLRFSRPEDETECGHAYLLSVTVALRSQAEQQAHGSRLHLGAGAVQELRLPQIHPSNHSQWQSTY